MIGPYQYRLSQVIQAESRAFVSRTWYDSFHDQLRRQQHDTLQMEL